MRNLIAVPLLGLSVILQSAVMGHITLLSGYGDLVLVMLAAWAIQPDVDSAWQWALLASIFVGFISRLPWPVVVLGYLSVVLTAQLLRKRIWQAPLLAMLATTLFGTLVMHMLTVISLTLTGSLLSPADAFGLVTLPSLLLNLLFAIPMYALMRDLGRWVYPEEELV